ncbi:MAG: FtsW/RodA/SpoVE family cell cycle protein [Chloroflexaceae bacterium]|nr:FtsW/RodA/SpoVE family cell cycle protein [Chloroflexaceae bacterium]
MLRYFIPGLDANTQEWALEARLLRWLTFLWLFIGLAALFSASFAVADAEQGDGLYYFKRQLFWALIGTAGLNVIARSPLRDALKVAPWALLGLLGMILVTLVPGLGTTVNGATRWLSLGPVLIQPSELIKPFLVLQGAVVFGRWQRLSWPVRLGWLGIFGLVLAAILLQPNLSTTALCGMTLWLIALAANLPLTYLGGTAILGSLTAVLSISIHEYQRRRIMSFLDPWADPKEDGYQLIQSLLAIGSGGAWGTGLGLSQQKLFYLPIQYTDFIFSVYAEEFGFIGSLLLLILLVAYASIALRVVLGCRHPVNRLVAMGATILLVGQSLLNIGVATGTLPTTGLPLPLFSYGGSSIIASLVAAGLLIRVARESREGEVVSFKGNARNLNLKSPRNRELAAHLHKIDRTDTHL